MERTNKKPKKKDEKKKPPQEKVAEDRQEHASGIPDVDFKKFLGCG